MTEKKPTLDEISKRITALPPEKRAIFERQLQQKNLQLAKPTIPRRKDTDTLPLSFAQERLWFLHQLDPDNSAYNIPIAWRFRGKLNIVTLKQSLNAIVRRHEALRTQFASVQGKPTQKIVSCLDLALPVIDLQALPEQQREIEVQRLAAEEAKRPFDLETEPLLRVTLLQLNRSESILLVILHHIIADGWSRGVLLKELATFYRAFEQGQPLSLPELPIQYVDFAVWQRQWLAGEELNTQLAYWKKQLFDLPVLNLPTRYPRQSVQTFRGATQSFTLPQNLTESLKALSRQQGVTLFMTLLAAFKILLHRYSNQEDIVVGSPIANRNWTETEKLIGFFVNTLVLRTNLSGNPIFLETLSRVREVTSGAYRHQDLPFAKLVEALQPERNLNHNPLFQVMFQLQNEAYQSQNSLAPELALPDLTLSQFWIAPQSTKFDLTWHLVEREAEILAVVEYSTALFDKDAIARMLNHFQRLLEGIVANPQARISELPILTDAERHQLLVEWNDTATDYPLDKCIHQLFEEQVGRTPDRIAVVCGRQSLTYRELNQKANQLAHYLRRLGVKTETLVGICLERSLEMVVGLLGILKAGGAYVPLDPTYPQERLEFMLEDTGLEVLLAGDRRRKVIELDRDWEIIDRESRENLSSNVMPDNLAYVIYTSGSTGKPKGTMLAHRGLVNYLSWAVQAYRVSEGKGSPVQSSIGFDATITSLYTPLLVGRTVVLLPEQQEIEALSAAFSAKNHYSLVKLTPAHLSILSQLLPTEPDEEPGDQTNAMIIGGEALLGNSLSFWQAYMPNTRLINEYGPTETVVGCCVYEVPTQTLLSGTVPIGRPIANTQLYILDRYLQPVPVGVPGELYIGGAGVARGYLNRPDLTAERFIPNPFENSKSSSSSLRKGGRGGISLGGIQNLKLYKTGDLARYLPNGNIEYLGRLDNQVKIRGFRVELGEIEAVLTQHPQVQEAIVTAQEDAQGNKRLVAYLVSIQNSAVLEQSFADGYKIQNFKDFLQETLPDYMIPAVFVTIEALPLTANGKVDRKALPSPDFSNRDPLTSHPYVSPRTPNEEILATIWTEVLGAKQVGIHDNFFELGGDSILSIQIIARANQVGLQLTPRQLFQHQTIAELAAVAGTVPSAQAEQGIVTGAIPLTPIQHWFFEQNLLNPDYYNQSILLEVISDLNPQFLEQALQQLLIHHDALRLRFVPSESSWQQFNAALDGNVPFITIDLYEFSKDEQKKQIEAIAAQIQASLDLATGTIIRGALFYLGDGQANRLLLVIHHLAVDGVSWRILLEDLAIAYQQLARGEKIQLPPKTTSYQDWSERLMVYSQSQAIAAELEYWLADNWSKVPPLPVDYPLGKEHNTVASTAQVTISLDAEKTQALLKEVPQVYNTQINDVLLTALAQALAQWMGTSSFLVDLESHGRESIFNDVNLSRTIGWFTSIVPVLLDLGNANQSGEALKTIKEQLRRLPQQGIGYGILRYLRKPDEMLYSHTEVIFNYLGQLDRVQAGFPFLSLAKESNGNRRDRLQTRRYLLEVNGFVTEDKLEVNWIYSQNIHQKATIERLAQSFLTALQTLIAHCQSPEAGGYTPSDFSAAKLDRKQLDKFLSKIQKTGRK